MNLIMGYTAARSPQPAARSPQHHKIIIVALCAGLSLPGAHAGWSNHGMTCATPNSTELVRLPQASRREFSGIGSTVRKISFYLELGNCEQHATDMSYALIPSYRQTRYWAGQPSNGALIPDSSSTVRGVAVQVLDAHAHPVLFEAPELHPVVDDHISERKHAKIPLQAQYIQTDDTITPGTLHAAMTVLFVYE